MKKELVSTIGQEIAEKSGWVIKPSVIDNHPRIKQLEEAAREALTSLAVFKITDTEKPYAEISPTYRAQLLKTHDLLLSALGEVPSPQGKQDQPESPKSLGDN